MVLAAPSLAAGAAQHGATGNPGEPVTVVAESGELKLRGLLWRPVGRGPFAAILFNHGRGCMPQPACDTREAGIRNVGAEFGRHGYVCLALFRRGEGLSADQGTPASASIEREQRLHGDAAADSLQVRLLETAQLDDVRAGLALLRSEPDVDPRRIAVVGHSFGGSLALLLAEQDRALRAVVIFAGAPQSWQRSAGLRERLTEAVRPIEAPVLFAYAKNDYSVAPGETLAAEMHRLGKTHRLVLFPPQGDSAEQAHDTVYRGIAVGGPDVFDFLDRYLRP